MQLLSLAPRHAALFALLSATLLMSAPLSAQTKSYRLPDDWSGDKIGTVTGNPFLKDGKPLWRALHIWPDDPGNIANYQELSWSGKQWIVAAGQPGSHGGQPNINTDPSYLSFEVRGPWTGEPGFKLAAVAFVAPQKGNYQMTGKISGDIWGGSADKFHLAFSILDPKAKIVKRIGFLGVTQGKDVPFAAKNVFLEAGQQLVFTGMVAEPNQAGTIYLKTPKITLTGATKIGDSEINLLDNAPVATPATASATAPTSTPALKVGATVTLGGKVYVVVSIDGDNVSLRLKK